MLTMLPRPPRWKYGMLTFAATNADARLRLSCALNSSSVISSGPPGIDPPTLLTTAVGAPNRSEHNEKAAKTDSTLVASAIAPSSAAVAADHEYEVDGLQHRFEEVAGTPAGSGGGQDDAAYDTKQDAIHDGCRHPSPPSGQDPAGAILGGPGGVVLLP